jgi:Ca2+/Na+ antiporter
MVWLSLIAEELVALLTVRNVILCLIYSNLNNNNKDLGFILDIPSDVMGLTVLMWGNSVGDLISVSVVAKQGEKQ